jgi:beta-lactamase regulating signal transducer with metallopeptidase domain
MSVILDAAARGGVVLLVALLLTVALRRRSAAVRHLVWVGAIVVQLVLPLFAIWGPTWGVEVPAVVPVEMLQLAEGAGPSGQAGRQMSAGPSSTGPSLHSLRRRSGQAGRQTSAALSPQSERPTTPTQIIAALWMLGALGVLVRLAVGTALVAVLARKGSLVRDGRWLALLRSTSDTLRIRRPLTLLRGASLGVPVTWGILRPVVMLPADADEWPDERRRLVLVHELAHVTRFDALTQLAGQLALALFWFDPLVWLATRRMQLEREHACDDYVIRHGATPSAYAEELLSMVRSLSVADAVQPTCAALAMARRSEFEGRMVSILNPLLDRHPLNRRRAAMSAVAALFLIVPLAALHPYRSARTMAPPPTTAIMTIASPSAATQRIEIVSPRPAGTSPMTLMTISAAAATATATSSTSVASSGDGPHARPTTCDEARFDGSPQSSLSVHSDNDGRGSSSLEYFNVTTNRCASAAVVGDVVYTPAEDDIALVPGGGSATFREKTPSTDRELRIAASNGGMVRSYRLNGQPASFDAEARTWFAAFLPRMLEETSFNAAPRIARWVARGGVDEALRHIAAMQSSNAKRMHYDALMQSRVLTPTQAGQLVRDAAATLRGSSNDMRVVVARAAAGTRNDPQIVPALEQAVSGMSSSADKTAVLMAYAESSEPDMLLAVVRLSRTIPDSHDRARLLTSMMARGVITSGPLQENFLAAAREIPNEIERRRVLEAAARQH